jgi:hypothetical protein
LIIHACAYNINVVYEINGRAIPVPVHGSKDLPKGLVKAILTQAERKEGMK